MKVLAVIGMGPGVSAAVARRFAREGFSVAAIARNPDKLAAQVEELAKSGARAEAFSADAGEPGALRAALSSVAARLGEIDVLVYNPVGVHYKPLSELTAEELNADLRLSVGGALAAAQALLPAMKARGSGTLLFTGGGYAFEPTPMLASVGAGKAALRNLAFSLYADLKDGGIHAATVTIGGVVKAQTPFDPDAIAESYWQLHMQPKGSFEREIVFKG
ncbi:MAG: SDR family NAD(P)-dependent oxidoreductase [Hyphomicrobium sp.]|nr:SDR family NAD(P)-dependent oxidoreductase [Hyphomicrobium sp.]